MLKLLAVFRALKFLSDPRVIVLLTAINGVAVATKQVAAPNTLAYQVADVLVEALGLAIGGGATAALKKKAEPPANAEEAAKALS